MAEIIVKDDETPQDVARELLDQAEHPDHVVWTPRSNTPHGGVFTVPDDKVEELASRRQAAREASQKATQRRIDAMNERDEILDRTGATPDELGIGAFSDEDRASLGMPGADPVEIDPARSGEQQRLEADARRDGVAEAQDAQVERAEARRAAAEERGDAADEAEAAKTEADIADEDKAAANRAAARKAAAKKRAEAAAAANSDKE